VAFHCGFISAIIARDIILHTKRKAKGIAMVNTIRFGDNFKRERKVNGKVKVYEGLDLVQYHIDNGQYEYAKELLGRIQFAKLAKPAISNDMSIEFSSLSELL